MTRIYLIRHAEAEGNLYRRIHGQYDSLVTPNGYRQIKALAERFRSIPVDAVYASDLFRTRTTAAAVYQPKGLPLVTVPALREISMGEWEDHPWGEIARREPEELGRFNICSPAFRAPGGESYPELRNRVCRALWDIARENPGKTVAVVSHGMAIRTALAAFRGWSIEDTIRVQHSDNTGVACLEAEGDAKHIVFENDASHLTEEISTFAHQQWWRAQNAALADPNIWFRPLDFEKEGAIYDACRREAWQVIHGTMDHFDAAAFAAAARANSAEDPQAVCLAMLGDSPAGVIQLDMHRWSQAGAGYIPFFYMAPEHRRKGMGVQLLGHAVSCFRRRGLTKIRLRCAPENLVAQRFYKRNGFYKIGRAQDSAVPLDLLEKDIGYDTQPEV